LFEFSEVSPIVQPYSRAEEVWHEILKREGADVFVSDVEGQVVATSMLITAPNLLRTGCQHGFLENVVTHPERRRMGYGTATVSAALEHAWRINCHHVLMQSGRADPRVHAFYERLGFMPGLRVGYVAMRPMLPNRE